MNADLEDTDQVCLPGPTFNVKAIKGYHQRKQLLPVVLLQIMS